MTKPKHGGRRANQTGRPRKANPRTEQVKTTLTPDEAQRIDAACKPGETRAACVRRLVLAALDHS